MWLQCICQGNLFKNHQDLYQPGQGFVIHVYQKKGGQVHCIMIQSDNIVTILNFPEAVIRAELGVTHWKDFVKWQ